MADGFIQTGLGMVAAGLQADRSTAAASPAFSHGVKEGSLIGLERSIENSPVACGIRTEAIDSYISEIKSVMQFNSYAYADVLGLYLLMALGSCTSTAVAGSEGTYSHVFQLGPSIPSATMWSLIGDDADDNKRLAGAKVDTLDLSFEGNAPVDVALSLVGLAMSWTGAAFPGSDPSCFGGMFVPTDGTFLFSTAGGTLAATGDVVQSGSLSIANNLTPQRGAGQAQAGLVVEGKSKFSGSMKVIVADEEQYRRMITGADTGTSPTGNIVFGGFRWEFPHSANAAWSLSIEATKVPFDAAAMGVKADGGAGEMEFKFDALNLPSAAGSPVTVTLVNGTQSYAL